MFDIEKFRNYDFGNSVVSDNRVWVTSDDVCTSFGMDGKFADSSVIPYFSFSADLFKGEFSDPGKIPGAVIEKLEISDISVDEKNKKYSVKLVYVFNGERRELAFPAKRISFTPMKYRGMSYRNMYDTWFRDIEKTAYVESSKYFREEETFDLEDGYSVNVKTYADIEEKSPQYHIEKASLRRCELFKDGRSVYAWSDTDNSNPRIFFDFIRHSNGHRYFPFHIDLYGISYLDIDSGEAYHYIPEGYQHDAEWTYGESFIVTGVFYDKDTDLIAYEGCYWACPSDVMVGDFSQPLNYDPHLVSVYEVIEPDGEECCDIDFGRFEGGLLFVKCDQSEERSVSCAEIFERIKKMRQ